MGAEFSHDQVGRDLEDDIADVEQGEARGDLVRGEIQHRAQVMPLIRVHGLREADIRADCGAEEVQDPECGDDAKVQFSGVC